jgi:hypothetical protein
VFTVAQNTWDRVRALDGRTLKTLHQERDFQVSGVTTDHVLVRPLKAKQGKRLTVRRVDIELIAVKGRQRDELRSKTATELPECGVTSYVAAIVYEVTRSPSTPG